MFEGRTVYEKNYKYAIPLYTIKLQVIVLLMIAVNYLVASSTKNLEHTIVGTKTCDRSLTIKHDVALVHYTIIKNSSCTAS